MSIESPAATTYARALLDASGSDAAAVADELDSLVSSINEHADTWHSLIAPELTSTTRRAAIDGMSSDANPFTRNLLRLLVDNGRLAELPSVAATFRELVKQQLGQLDVSITTAVELPAALRAQLEERLSTSTGKQVTLHTSVDPEIIGGLVVQHGDTLIDTSLRSRLDQLRLRLTRPATRS